MQVFFFHSLRKTYSLEKKIYAHTHIHKSDHLVELKKSIGYKTQKQSDFETMKKPTHP